MEYSDALDELMEDICDKCRYPIQSEDQEQLDGICAGCTIRDEIENLMNQ